MAGIPIQLNVRVKNELSNYPEEMREQMRPRIQRKVVAEYNREQREKTRQEMAKKRRKWAVQDEWARVIKNDAEKAILAAISERVGETVSEELEEVKGEFLNALEKAFKKFKRG